MQTKGKKLDGIVFTNADPSFQYTGKLDDLQGGDTTTICKEVIQQRSAAG